MKKQESEAQIAFRMYETTKKKNAELARVYLLNAITHEPRIEYLREYAATIGKLVGNDLDAALPQAYNALSLSAMNGPAGQVEEIQSIIAKLQEREFAGVQGGKAHGGAKASESIRKELVKFSWDELQSSNQMLDKQAISEKCEAIKQALSSGLLAESETEELVNELDQTQWQLSCIVTLCSVDDGLEAAEDECNCKKPAPPRVGALMAQVAGSLAQLWTLRPEGPMTKTELNALCAARQKRFSAIEKKAQKIMSETAYAQAIDAKLSFERDVESATLLTTCIEMCQKCNQQLQLLLPKIAAPEYYERVVDMMKQIGESASEYGRRRYALYQKRMASLALSAIKKFDDKTVVFESDAEKILKDCKIARIDESLLSPEASCIYQSAKSTVCAKLSTVKRAEFDYQCVTSDKFKLEEY